MSQTKLSADLLNELKSLKTTEQVEEFIGQRDLEWENLGGRNNNENVVHMVGDPANALTERVTNAIDACLERAVHENDIEDASSPRDAVEQLFGLSKAGYNDMPQKWVTSTADNNIKVSIEENGKRSRPVIQFRDRGIGQRPGDFEDTFLSLNEDSKVTKPYLIGKYGQGGAATFRFCNYAIIVSRHCDGGNIGWSIVRYNDRTDGEEEYTTGVYEYCTQPSGEIPTIPASGDFEGSIIRLVEYDATDFKSSLSAGAGNLYTVFHRTMFGSIFPFMLEDRRTDRFTAYDSPKRRSVVGSRYRLDKPSKYVEETRDFRRVDLGEYGALRIKYWVLNDGSKVDQFVDGTEPVVFTLHGQRHHAESKRYFKDGTDYSFLHDRIVVEVNCDDLSRAGRRAFTSDREAMSDSDQGRLIRRKVIEALEEDDKLEKLNEEYRQRVIRETSSEQEDRAKSLLADLLQNPKQGNEDEAPTEGGDGEEDGNDELVTNSGLVYEDEDLEELHDYPTFVKITNKQDPIPAKQGRTLRVEIETDADLKFEELDRGEITLDLTDVGALTFDRETSLENGRKYIYASVDEDADLGATGVITAKAEWENGHHQDERTVKITEPPATSSSASSGEFQSPEITQVDEENDTNDWDESDVVEFHPNEGDAGHVYVMMFNKSIQPILESIPTERSAKQRKSEYTGYMAYYEVMREKETQQGDMAVDEDYIKHEQNRVAKVLMRQIVEGMTPEDMI